MTPRFIAIGRSTGRINIVPPFQRHRAETKLCEWQNVTLSIKREGRANVIARYPALPQDNAWVFGVDDALRNSKSGWYVGTVYCCNKPMHSVRMRLLLPVFGSASAQDAERDMCDDWSDNNCVPVVAPCAPCKPVLPCVSRTQCGTTGPLPVCTVNCDPPTGNIDLTLYPPLSGPPPCAPCTIPCQTGNLSC